MITVYTTPQCHKCTSLKQKLDQAEIQYMEVSLNTPVLIKEVINKSGLMNAPIVQKDGKWLSQEEIYELTDED